MAATKKNRRSSKPTGRGLPVAELLKVVYHFDGTTPPGYDFEIGMKEYAAIGFFMVHWAFLEDVLFLRTQIFARRAKQPLPAMARDLSFTRRIQTLRELIQNVIKQPTARERWFRLLQKIANAEGRRHKLAHGLWLYNPKRPEHLLLGASQRMSKRARLVHFDFKETAEFALSIGRLSFELAHPRPGSGRPAKSSDEFFASMSRSFLLTLQGKDPKTLGLP